MQLHIVGGFLGSGKTTAIIAIAHQLIAQGNKVGVVTNDQGNYTLILKPTSHLIAKRLTQVELEIDRVRMIPITVSYAEKDGDTTTYRFTDIGINRPVDRALFHLQLPPDVSVVDLKLGSGE